MPSQFETPNPKAISDLFDMLFGPGTGASEISDSNLEEHQIATFIDDSGRLVAICACDRPFVVRSGAALSMIPRDVASEMLYEGDFTTAIESNFHEVMNICSRLLMSENSAHLRLEGVFPPDQCAARISELSKDATFLGFDVEIPGYGNGAMKFLVNQE